MRQYDPTNEDEVKEARELKAEPWMLELLKLNPNYIHWGPHEDYMSGSGSGWNAPGLHEKWDGGFHLDEYNEVVHFYFFVSRANKNCEACDGTGHNPKTKAIADSFYEHSSPDGKSWSDKITQDEVQALVDSNRLFDFTRKWVPNEGWVKDERPVPLAEEVNAAERSRRGVHDAINRWILIETRAKHLGVWGKCRVCEGAGRLFTEDEAKLGLVLWVLHPRKGASRGVEYTHVARDEVRDVIAYLRQAALRNTERFAKVVAAFVSETE